MINCTYCFTSDVMYKEYKRLVYAPPDLLARICKVNLSNAKKFGLICFPRICFRGLIYCDQEPLWLLNVIEDVCYFLGVLYTECKYGGPLGRPGSSCAKARLMRPQEFCFDCASQRLSRSIWFASSCCTPEGHQKEDFTLAGIAFTFPRSFHKES